MKPDSSCYAERTAHKKGMDLGLVLRNELVKKQGEEIWLRIKRATV